MATAKDARQQLSKDMRDFFESTTTTSDTGTDLDDALLTDFDDDTFVTDETSVWMEGGQTSGPVADEERAIASKLSNVMTAKRSFSVSIVSGLVYEVHRLYSARDKDSAINTALDLVLPILFKYVSTTIATVTDQFDYSLTSTGFLYNMPHAVHIVSEGDSEVTVPLFAWELLDGTTLHFKQRISGGRTLKLFGIGQAALTDISQPQLQILTSRAAMYLYEGTLAEAINADVTRFERLLVMESRRYTERKAQFKLMGPPATMRTEVYDNAGTDFNFGVV